MALHYLPILAKRAAPKPPRGLKRITKPAWRPLSLPLQEMPVALITSGAIREASQRPFPRLGDASYRGGYPPIQHSRTCTLITDRALAPMPVKIRKSFFPDGFSGCSPIKALSGASLLFISQSTVESVSTKKSRKNWLQLWCGSWCGGAWIWLYWYHTDLTATRPWVSFPTSSKPRVFQHWS